MQINNWHNQSLASYKLDSSENQNTLNKLEELSKDYSNKQVREEILTALKNGDSEKLAEISNNLATPQESNAYNRYLKEKGISIDEDKKFKFHSNIYEDIGITNDIWFANQVSVNDFTDKNGKVENNQELFAINSFKLNLFRTAHNKLLEANGVDVLDMGSIFSAPTNRSMINIDSAEKIDLDKEDIGQIIDEVIEYHNVDDETIESRMVSTDETPQEHQERFEKQKYLYEKTLEFIDILKKNFLDFNLIEDNYKSDRLLDVKA